MRTHLFLISFALSSVACSDQRDGADDASLSPGEANAVVGTAGDAAAPAIADAKPVDFDDSSQIEGGERTFSYSWPAAVSAIPALAARLEQDRDEQLVQQKAEWNETLAQAPADCATCRNRSYSEEWQVVADLPDWLSLSSKLSLYTGGAHGTYGRTSLVWDKDAGVGMSGVDMFKSPVALETALGSRLCSALNTQRARRRGEPVPPASRDMFDACPGIDQATVFVGSGNGRTFDRIGIYFGPYVAGPYAEGEYELDFPVTSAIIDAVKPEYARAFSVKR